MVSLVQRWLRSCSGYEITCTQLRNTDYLFYVYCNASLLVSPYLLPQRVENQPLIGDDQVHYHQRLCVLTMGSASWTGI